jgi:hypothetical protein
MGRACSMYVPKRQLQKEIHSEAGLFYVDINKQQFILKQHKKL